MNKLKNFKDVVDWGLCSGCGACLSIRDGHAPDHMQETVDGLRPLFNSHRKGNAAELSMCPGYRVATKEKTEHTTSKEYNVAFLEHPLIGRFNHIFNGYAGDPVIRYRGSSGGVLTALSLYCLDNGIADYVVHTGSSPTLPWRNITRFSKNRNDLLQNTGSRYVTSSPCEALKVIEQDNKKYIFIGKPCDISAVRTAIESRPVLSERILILLTFFCAGTPSTLGTKNLISDLGVVPEKIKSIQYRGCGWPGRFLVTTSNEEEYSRSYEQSWGYLQHFRPLRCYLCADGLGELGDISCGDAWDLFSKQTTGISYLLTRTAIGVELLESAQDAGYVILETSDADHVISAQPGLINRKKAMYGRLLARKLLGIPTIEYSGFRLKSIWRTVQLKEKIRIVAGTLKRILLRGYWHRRPPQILS